MFGENRIAEYLKGKIGTDGRISKNANKNTIKNGKKKGRIERNTFRTGTWDVRTVIAAGKMREIYIQEICRDILSFIRRRK